MNQQSEIRAELLALVQQTKENLNQSRLRMFLLDEESLQWCCSATQCKTVERAPSFHQLEKKAAPIPPPEANEPEEKIEVFHLKKDASRFLPRSFEPSTTDTAIVREAMQKVDGMPHLSASPIYSGASKKANKQWAICSYFCSQESSKRVSFVEAVTKAISTRLSIETIPLSCEETSFAQMLPLIGGDCDAIFFFIDQHLETKVRELLRTIPAYDPTPHSTAAPFVSLGSLYKKPLRALTLNEQTSENQSLKQELWASLRALVPSRG